MKILAFFCVCVLSLSSCALETGKYNQEVQGEVLKPGMVVNISNPSGDVAVGFISETKRMIRTPAVSKVINVIPREEEFRGKKGVYNPGQQFGMGDLPMRIVYIESELYFDSKSEANSFAVEGSNLFKWVGNDQAYVGGWFISPGRNQINVTVYRYFVNGIPYRPLLRVHGDVIVQRGQ